jgi:hypothetical protein
MTPEALNPASARFDFMKWVSLNNQMAPMSEYESIFEGSFLVEDERLDERQEQEH